MERRTNAPAHFSSSETPPCLPPPRPGGATRLETAASAPARRRDVGVAKPETKRPTALWAPASARYVGEGVGRLRGCRLLEVRPLQGHTLLDHQAGFFHGSSYIQNKGRETAQESG
ncbi:hypothetical protein MUK42_37523 [Musa troglodytarum]|uniref:Uncharacterized protein n=1 Tax=Musa troglodytarum TaxID=320322 RepID=A0A9E7KHC3_9LILI|nr:hypothetical protein MUK42_37523 [Musa troglodytarum]